MTLDKLLTSFWSSFKSGGADKNDVIFSYASHVWSLDFFSFTNFSDISHAESVLNLCNESLSDSKVGFSTRPLRISIHFACLHFSFLSMIDQLKSSCLKQISPPDQKIFKAKLKFTARICQNLPTLSSSEVSLKELQSEIDIWANLISSFSLFCLYLRFVEPENWMNAVSSANPKSVVLMIRQLLMEVMAASLQSISCSNQTTSIDNFLMQMITSISRKIHLFVNYQQGSLSKSYLSIAAISHVQNASIALMLQIITLAVSTQTLLSNVNTSMFISAIMQYLSTSLSRIWSSSISSGDATLASLSFSHLSYDERRALISQVDDFNLKHHNSPTQVGLRLIFLPPLSPLAALLLHGGGNVSRCIFSSVVNWATSSGNIALQSSAVDIMHLVGAHVASCQDSHCMTNLLATWQMLLGLSISAGSSEEAVWSLLARPSETQRHLIRLVHAVYVGASSQTTETSKTLLNLMETTFEDVCGAACNTILQCFEGSPSNPCTPEQQYLANGVSLVSLGALLASAPRGIVDRIGDVIPEDLVLAAVTALENSANVRQTSQGNWKIAEVVARSVGEFLRELVTFPCSHWIIHVAKLHFKVANLIYLAFKAETNSVSELMSCSSNPTLHDSSHGVKRTFAWTLPVVAQLPPGPGDSTWMTLGKFAEGLLANSTDTNFIRTLFLDSLCNSSGSRWKNTQSGIQFANFLKDAAHGVSSPLSLALDVTILSSLSNSLLETEEISSSLQTNSTAPGILSYVESIFKPASAEEGIRRLRKMSTRHHSHAQFADSMPPSISCPISCSSVNSVSSDLIFEVDEDDFGFGAPPELPVRKPVSSIPYASATVSPNDLNPVLVFQGLNKQQSHSSKSFGDNIQNTSAGGGTTPQPSSYESTPQQRVFEGVFVDEGNQDNRLSSFAGINEKCLEGSPDF